MHNSSDNKFPNTIATSVTALAKKARSVVRDLNPLNDLTFFRVKSKNKEIMVAPDKHLFLIVIQSLETEQKLWELLCNRLLKSVWDPKCF